MIIAESPPVSHEPKLSEPQSKPLLQCALPCAIWGDAKVFAYSKLAYMGITPASANLLARNGSPRQ